MVVEAQYLHVPLLQRVFALLAFFHEREKELSLSLSRSLSLVWLAFTTRVRDDSQAMLSVLSQQSGSLTEKRSDSMQNKPNKSENSCLSLVQSGKVSIYLLPRS